MPAERAWVLFIIVVTSLVSGLGDSQGFVHAAQMWQGGHLVWRECWKSGAGFAVGIGVYWICVRYLGEFGVHAPEAQSLIWFGTTIVGVAVVSGQWSRWQRMDQVVAAAVLLGIAWLLFRAS